MALSDAQILLSQAPIGTPQSSLTDITTDPMLPPQRTADMLAHFHERVYDLAPESHLSKLLKVILGEPGVGGLQKKYTYSHLAQVLASIRYYELDRFYADVFSISRLIHERLVFDPFDGTGDSDEWEQMDSADSDYRNRVQQFARAVLWAGTPNGMVMGASAILGNDVRVYESYTFLDDSGTYDPGVGAGARTYGDVEALGRYGDLETYTYGELENTNPFQGRVDNSRGEFIIKPLRNISAEERYHLIKVLTRLKPAEALMTIDLTGGQVARPVRVLRAVADSEYWHVRQSIRATSQNADIYTRFNALQAVEQPRPVSAYYQGEAWNYNGDVNAISSYVVTTDPGGVEKNSLYGNHLEKVNQGTGQVTAYPSSNALASLVDIMQGRTVSDGVIASSPVTAARGGAAA